MCVESWKAVYEIHCAGDKHRAQQHDLRASVHLSIIHQRTVWKRLLTAVKNTHDCIPTPSSYLLAVVLYGITLASQGHRFVPATLESGTGGLQRKEDFVQAQQEVGWWGGEGGER